MYNVELGNASGAIVSMRRSNSGNVLVGDDKRGTRFVRGKGGRGGSEVHAEIMVLIAFGVVFEFEQRSSSAHLSIQ